MKILSNVRRFPFIAFALSLALSAGCRLDMRDQPRVDPLAQSTFFADQASARPRVPDTVARGQLDLDEHLYTGRINGEFAPTFPFTVTQTTLERGQERYTIFCAPCHGLTGDGKGVVTQYGMPEPPSLHSADLRDQPPGYFFDIITAGTRVMPSYAARIPPGDRWAIIAYIRALQLSQNANSSQVPADALTKLGATAPLTQTETITKSDTVTK
jgi:mono/diheme cytochrome c family protein